VAFIHDPSNLQQVAFGEKSLCIKSTGETFTIPKTLRTKVQEVIWREYRAAHTFPDGSYDGLERSTFLAFCNEATGGQQKALGALDNIAVRYGTENWEQVEASIVDLISALQLSDDAKNKLYALCRKVQNHIKYDLRLHLRQSSQCSRHCYIHLLSDATDAENRGVCPDTCGSHEAQSCSYLGLESMSICITPIA